MNNNLSFGVFDGSTDVDFKKFLPIQSSQDNQEFYTKDIDFGVPELTKKERILFKRHKPRNKLNSTVFTQKFSNSKLIFKVVQEWPGYQKLSSWLGYFK